MTFDDFHNSLTASAPPAELTPALAGLWWDAKGDWNASWVHAYLHRKEGDQENAAYWYRRAKKPICRGPLEAEWRRIASDLVE